MNAISRSSVRENRTHEEGNSEPHFRTWVDAFAARVKDQANELLAAAELEARMLYEKHDR